MTIAPFETKIGDKVVTLELTYQACHRVSEYFGGLVPANHRVAAVDTEAMRKILATGLNKPLAADDGMDAMIYEAGALTVQPILFDYLDRLATGGRGTPKVKPDVAA
ncbi:hypothetical protein [Tardiphaga sp.]|uniref:hypothetical protein n=1 Tax=Tardiphaga sp. TaxID=1926292 RepID=UPI00263808C0|nr:hypothetical protein [Tardiphaga sp.]MDB5616102.1 hypothetical protein [Tardiphaga sp.]